ncbi:MAG: hypothetical protein VKO39_07415 [Cyanobacteriota bacterium]|nr:hypothetical protein [Cyanobacteriota bacterium]
MTEFSAEDLLDGFPIPAEAIVVPAGATGTAEPPADEQRSLRRLVLAALRQALQDRQLSLPLGPSLDPEDPARLLSLNQLAVQLVVTGISSDQVSFDSDPWHRAETAPQLLVAASVDEDLRIVHIAGVLTASEVAAVHGDCDPDAQTLHLPIQAFKGGIERLFTLASLVRSSALPRCSLLQSAAVPLLARVGDWCRGELSAAFDAIGTTLIPVGASAFRQASDSSADLPEGSLAIVAIPLGLTPSGEIRTGDEAQRCVERFRLLLIPSASTKIHSNPQADQLTLRLQADPAGDLLPDGIALAVAQATRRQSLITANSTVLELQLPADEAPLLITITPPTGPALELPAVQLGAA